MISGEAGPPSAVRAWWLAIRPKTLSAAVAPVLVGTALAAHDGRFAPLPALAALLGALLIQIGTNLANDVLDFHRGADDGARLGPTRVTQAGLLSPGRVGAGAALCFGAAAAIGLYLTARAGLPILAVGAAAIVSGVLYTAGPYPLAYVGLGDLFVLVFFGLAAVAGTYYVQALGVTPEALLLGVAVGALAVAILNVNNLRDIDTDRGVGKRTLAVRLGVRTTRRYLAVVVTAAFVLPVAMVALGALPLPALLVLAAAPGGWRLIRGILAGTEGRALNPLLGATARLQVLHALLLSLGLAAGAIAGWGPA